ncbi:hypothetical protein THAOC_31610 [Thalassiosira oceanica]|uniref:Uncharacterized protein n=1 Tax=Thalassiosira oceanica TaxID=159749 RepID=K0R8V5_THAOC|nr:hypothetical protein THAOC_31610 [Thalassiosira oceanica]|eukprot:EJK49510.1 hypothetical protein THAOC_31610 [Thalassiosira oceanica]
MMAPRLVTVLPHEPLPPPSAGPGRIHLQGSLVPQAKGGTLQSSPTDGGGDGTHGGGIGCRDADSIAEALGRSLRSLFAATCGDLVSPCDGDGGEGLEVVVSSESKACACVFLPTPVPRPDLRVPPQEGRVLPPRPPRVGRVARRDDPAGRRGGLPGREREVRRTGPAGDPRGPRRGRVRPGRRVREVGTGGPSQVPPADLQPGEQEAGADGGGDRGEKADDEVRPRRLRPGPGAAGRGRGRGGTRGGRRGRPAGELSGAFRGRVRARSGERRRRVPERRAG